MLFNSYDEGCPYFDNDEILEEYQMMLDYIFDLALNKEIGTDDFDLAAEALPDPSLDQAHEQIVEIMDWIDAAIYMIGPNLKKPIKIKRTKRVIS